MQPFVRTVVYSNPITILAYIAAVKEVINRGNLVDRNYWPNITISQKCVRLYTFISVIVVILMDWGVRGNLIEGFCCCSPFESEFYSIQDLQLVTI